MKCKTSDYKLCASYEILVSCSLLKKHTLLSSGTMLCFFFIFICSCIVNIIPNYNQQDATFTTKKFQVTTNVVGCNFELYLRCTNIWISNL